MYETILEMYEMVLEIGRRSSVLRSVEKYDPILEKYEMVLEIERAISILHSIEKYEPYW